MAALEKIAIILTPLSARNDKMNCPIAMTAMSETHANE